MTSTLQARLPTLEESVEYVRELGKPTAAQVLAECRAAGRLAVQPRSGVGDHARMLELVTGLEEGARPELLTITIDAHTRLKRFDHALRVLNRNPAELNGYPLVTHGWERGRELNEAVRAPLEIRHGSPDARVLFDTAVASGITSFEGGGISYNVPYAKDVPIAESLACWAAVDEIAGELARRGLVIDRELFGTLTAVLVPPSISLAVSVLEAVEAARCGVRCVSISYPQGGHLAQDVAALRAIRVLAARYLPAEVQVHAVLHEFMGVFPRERRDAEELIFFGALTARLGGATKVVTKTYQEAHGIPDVAANVAGLRLAAIAGSELLAGLRVDEDAVAEELEQVLQEVTEIVEPLLAAPVLAPAIAAAFADGRLDIPFSASRHARSDVIPRRAADGSIRYHDHGRLPLSAASARRNRDQLDSAVRRAPLVAGLRNDINYFSEVLREPSDAH